MVLVIFYKHSTGQIQILQIRSGLPGFFVEISLNDLNLLLKMNDDLKHFIHVARLLKRRMGGFGELKPRLNSRL